MPGPGEGLPPPGPLTRRADTAEKKTRQWRAVAEHARSGALRVNAGRLVARPGDVLLVRAVVRDGPSCAVLAADLQDPVGQATQKRPVGTRAALPVEHKELRPGNADELEQVVH
jgi:hypothetical protein